MSASIEKHTAGFGLSFVITSLLATLLLIFKETYEPLKNAMKAATGHHWITHGVLTILIFLFLGPLFSKMNLENILDNKKVLRYILGTIILCTLVIGGFYLKHL
jgi:hypothetical protein